MPNKEENNISKLNQGINNTSQGSQPISPVGSFQAQNVNSPQMMSQQPVMQQPIAQPSLQQVQSQMVQTQPMMNQSVVQQPVQQVQQQMMNQPGMGVQSIQQSEMQPQTGNIVDITKKGLNFYVDKLKTNKVVLFGSIGGVVLVLLLFVFIVSKLINPSYNIVNRYMSIMKNGKEEKIVKLYHEDVIKARYKNEDELVKDFKEVLKEMDDEDTVIKGFKVRECETYSEDELEYMADYMDQYLDIEEKRVKAAKKCWIKVDIDEDGERNIDYVSVVVVKVDNKWSLYYGQ